jgi:hypothetical protein
MKATITGSVQHTPRPRNTDARERAAPRERRHSHSRPEHHALSLRCPTAHATKIEPERRLE